MKAFLVLALAVATVSAGVIPDASQSAIDGRITNGYPAADGSVPYIVGLHFDNWAWCSGSIISNTWVVTAAHCTNGATGVTINYGATIRTQPQFTHHVGSANIIQNQKWPNTNGNDISLIRTPSVTFGNLVKKIELPSFNDINNSYDGWWSVACGWGRTYDGSSLPDRLQCVDVQIMSNSECSQIYNINDGILCIRVVDGKATCQGDSGGSLVTHNGKKLVGITSFAPAAGCQSGLPDGFTRVTKQLQWIRDVSGVAYY